jgi:autotransporter translocation and assembly factor TamB
VILAFLRRAAWWLAIAVTAFAALLLVALLVVQTGWFKQRVRRVAVSQANKYLNGELSIGRLEGNLFSGVTLSDVRLVQAGEPSIAVKRLRVDYNARQLMREGWIFPSLILDEPHIIMRRTATGWNLGRLLKPRQTPGGPAPRLTFTRLVINNGQYHIEDRPGTVPGAPAAVAGERARWPRTLHPINASFGFSSGPWGYSFDIERLAFGTDQPGLAMRALDGTITSRGGDLNLDAVHVVTTNSDVRVNGELRDYAKDLTYALDVNAARLSMPELSRFLPGLDRMALHPSFSARLDGPDERLRIVLKDLRSEAGRADGTLTANLVGPERRLEGRLDVERVNLELIFDDKDQASVLTGHTDFDLRFPPRSREGFADGRFAFRGPVAYWFGYQASSVRADGTLAGRRVSIRKASASAYGGSVTTRGTIDLPARRKPLALGLTGTVKGADLRRLPRRLSLPQFATNLDLEYDVRGPTEDLDASFRIHPSVIEGAQIGGGSVAGFTRHGRRFDYRATGALSGADLQRFGRVLSIETLTTDRFRGEVSGEFDVHGTYLPRTRPSLTATGTIVQSTMFGGRIPKMEATATLGNNALQVKARGDFAGLDLPTLTAREQPVGRVSGNADVEVHIPDVSAELTPDYLDVGGTVGLVDSSVAGLDVKSLQAMGRYQDALAQIDSLTATGPDYALKGSGTVSLNDTASSDFVYQLDVEEIKSFASRYGQSVSGAATVAGRITGNRTELVTTGTLTAAKVGYADKATAEKVASAFTVVLPNLDRAALRADATSTVAGLTGYGVDVSTLEATTEYASNALTLGMRADEARGSASAQGRALFGDGRQDIELTALTLNREGVAWGMPQGRTARAVIEPTHATIEGLTLERGAQRIAADGRVGIDQAAASDLRVRVERVDLAEIDRLLFAGKQRLGGSLDASAHIGGTRAAPVVTADTRVLQGLFRDFKYQSLAGTVKYDGHLANVDLRLDQSPSAWLTAKGIVPRTLLQARDKGGHVEPTAADRIDLAVQTSRLNLALVEGFTTAVTKVSGTAEVQLHVTNTGQDPHIEGTATIVNGAFTVPLTGLSYQSLDARVAFRQERLDVERLVLTDDRKRPLEVTGQIAVHRTEVGAVRVNVRATDFSLFNNRYGDVDADVNLRIEGELWRPSIQGDIELKSARLEVDRILESFAPQSYYATESAYRAPGSPAPPAEPDASAPKPGPGQKAAAAGAKEERPPLIDTMALNVRVKIPNNLVLRGDDLQTGSSGFALGDINVTMGGDFRVAKTPGNPTVLVGVVNTVRGTYRFQGRQFDILRDGRVVFRGREEINPDLDITAERVIQGVQAQVRIGGTARKPTVSLQSQPPLDEGDILALIVFNQPASKIGEGQGNLAESAGGFAAGLVVSPLAESIGDALNVDLFEVQTTDDAGRITPSLVIGEQVGDQVFVKFRQQFGARQVSEFQLEYQLADFLRWQGSVAEGEGVGLANRSLTQRIERYGTDLVFFFAY